MKNLFLEREDLEISEKLDEDGECWIWAEGYARINKEEIQQVIDHLTLLLEEAK